MRSRLRTVVDVSRTAADQYSDPAVPGLMPPSAPVVATMLRRPFVSVFATLVPVEFGLAMYTNVLVSTVTEPADVVNVGAVADSAIAVTVAAAAMLSVSAVVP